MGKNQKNETCRENIKVIVRIRPLLGREQSTEVVTQVSDDKTVVKIETETHNVHAQFDHVFSPETTQSEVYDEVRFAADSVVRGYNSTIFAYGQTGSGKSFTMFGPEDDLSIYGTGQPSEAMGIIPRCIREILQKVESIHIESKKGEPEDEEEVSVFCSFMQIYNDQPYDLLRDPYRVRPLQVHENTNTKEVYVVGLSEYVVNHLDDCLALLEQGDEQRACRQTTMNDVSSRSHSIFQMVVERRKVHSGRVIRSKLNLVDLAGSEKWGINDQLEKGHISELTNINTSLHTLGRCIAALTDPETTHVPFRDSKLTRILMDALGGNSRTCVIATMSPSEAYLEESISTLKFADRAKRVMQHAKVIETREVTVELVERLEREIDYLKSLLSQHGVDPSLYSTVGSGTAITFDEGSAEPTREASAENSSSSSSGSSNLQLERAFFDAQEKIRRLEKENTKLRAASGIPDDHRLLGGSSSQEGGGQPSSTASALAVAADAEAENKKLKSILLNVKNVAKRFFRFEIEEEEFQDMFEKYMVVAGTILKSQGNSPKGSTSVYSKKMGGGISFRGSAEGVAKKPDSEPSVRTKAMYRVRGKSSEGGGGINQEWTPSAPNMEAKAKSISASLRDKQKELAKHKKLQQYLAEKAQRELERIESERSREEQESSGKKQKDKQFTKHASLVKRKLMELKETERKLEQEEARLLSQGALDTSFNQDEEETKGTVLPKINNKNNSLLESDGRPISRQTIFEDEPGEYEDFKGSLSYASPRKVSTVE